MFILHYDDHGVDKAHELRLGVTLIGRLPTSDLMIADASVSRRHASLRTTEGKCFVQDTASRFGTFVNGARVQDEVELTPGHTLKLGEVTFTLEQRVPEQELLSEGHEVSEGPGTIYRPVDGRAGGGERRPSRAPARRDGPHAARHADRSRRSSIASWTSRSRRSRPSARF